MVKCPTCKVDVNIKPLKEWDIQLKAKKKGPKLHVKLYEHWEEVQGSSKGIM